MVGGGLSQTRLGATGQSGSALTPQTGTLAGRKRLKNRDFRAVVVAKYWVDDGAGRALKTQLLSTHRYSLVPPCSGSSPVVPAIFLLSLITFTDI